MASLQARRALVSACTSPTTFSLCPELPVLAAPEPLAVWEATEALTGQVEPPPFWAHAWPGSLALARFVLDGPALVRGKRVLDFAAGGGLAGLAAAKAGGVVEATEVDLFAVAAIEENAARTGLPVTPRLGDVLGADEGWDVVLVGDVFYQAALSQLVQAWVGALARRGAVVLVGDPGRRFFPSASMQVEASYGVQAVPAWDSVVDRAARVWRVGT